jgi:hypothetical protein
MSGLIRGPVTRSGIIPDKCMKRHFEGVINGKGLA